jgi:hypothetical protein
MATDPEALGRGPFPHVSGEFVDLVFEMRKARHLMIVEADNELPAGEAQSLYFALGVKVDEAIADFYALVAQWHQRDESAGG